MRNPQEGQRASRSVLTVNGHASAMLQGGGANVLTTGRKGSLNHVLEPGHGEL